MFYCVITGSRKLVVGRTSKAHIHMFPSPPPERHPKKEKQQNTIGIEETLPLLNISIFTSD